MSSVSSIQSPTATPVPRHQVIDADGDKDASKAAAERPPVQHTPPKPVESPARPTSTMGNNVNVVA